mmetsp:Transcript_7131/g.15602  ORF Transcript_7131/g.15602 Transcript_7131/m.15602 type:complete len:269 (+) Transcript_7131:95-901(+)|eukprot:CAMPEP_0202901074 /NCGR_PEP_ID=MMETSP1392-20130828/13099_1 /ASSEMBLY_ACC=CAM_ASM_000868 /TAXON_ID=225041 /ORGANISM="Chlamydomonas chlamydogama, Strain SAG 11-48b" /LENGTH=268 /DNA_ID=CAMNT_0049587569 /DNA_START=94 /DNA_END=900 /DNA_ORIENTATION=+
MAASDDAKIQQYLLLAKGARGRAAADLISKATSEPGLFAFGELLATPALAEIQNGDLAQHYSLLQLFAYGTWPEYKASAASLPALNDQQRLKLKQLTTVSLAIKSKVIAYETLMQHLDIPTVRELEDFLITECFYANIIQGKLDQKQRALHVVDVIGRDVRLTELPDLAASLTAWLRGSEAVLGSIEGRIQYAQSAAEAAKKHKEDVDAKQDEARKNVKTEFDLRGDAMLLDDGMFDYMDEDRLERPERMDRADRAERAAGRPKYRRR